MPLVGDIQTRFREILKVSTHVDMAVAWATSGWALDRLADAAQKHEISLRAIVGTHGNATEPDAVVCACSIDRLFRTQPLRSMVSWT